MKDPTREEMLAFLQTQACGEDVSDDAEAAMYWFSYEYHGGQSSNLYSVLSTSPFHPGPLCNGPEVDSFEALLHQSLVQEFGS